MKVKKNEKLIKIARCLESVKCNKGLHASGYIVTNNSASQYVPVLKDEKTNWLYSEYTFDILEFVGLYKNDLLGLKQLTKLKQLSDEIATNKKVEFDYKSIPLVHQSHGGKRYQCSHRVYVAGFNSHRDKIQDDTA